METPKYDQEPTDELQSFIDDEAAAAAVEERLASLAIAEGIHNLIQMAASDASYGELQHAMNAFFAPTSPAVGRRAR
jgi:hypothetical protein